MIPLFQVKNPNQVIPNYDVFASLLNGTWMPWLGHNRLPGRFDRLLQEVDDSSGDACRQLFSTMARHMGLRQSPAVQRFSRETDYLAGTCSGGPDTGGAAFMALPALTSGQQFYNRLIGYSLNGYHRWMSLLLNDLYGTETAGWCRMRTTRILQDLLRCPVPGDAAVHAERMIAARARAALCVLLHRLTVPPRSSSGPLSPAGSIRASLLGGLAGCNLEALARDEIIALYDALTAPAPAPASPAPHTLTAQGMPLPAEQADADLAALVTEMKMEFDQVRRAVCQLITSGPLSGKPPAAPPDQYLSSARVRELLSTSNSSLQRYRDAGLLPFIKIGRKCLYSLKDVKAFLEKAKNKKSDNTDHP